ncbi:MAG: macro domain-containing protein [Candidatus Woesearchaeota archaeon]
MDEEPKKARITCAQGDITQQDDIDVIVNAANSRLMPGGGVAGAIHRAAGPELAEECQRLAPIAPGEATITDAYDLPNKRIIHTLGPVYGRDKPEDEILKKCIVNSLRLAEKEKAGSIAFPAISTGAFGYPIDEAARTTMKTMREIIHRLESLEEIRFVLFSKHDYDVFKDTFKRTGL